MGVTCLALIVGGNIDELAKKEKRMQVAFLGIILAFGKKERKARRNCGRSSSLREEHGLSLNCKAKENFKETGWRGVGSKKGREEWGLG